MDSFTINPNRKKILDRFQGKITTQEDFDFNMLSAPPMYCLFTNQDIWDMYDISSSLRLSGNPKKKKKLINDILNRRGFTMVSSGTNRVTYKYAGDNSFLAKLAYDKVGREANIDEFQNMLVFKPYVSKIFEADPTGTVQICERVEACTHKTSYDSIYPYVDILRRKWFFGEYVWKDIGDDAWMNWGVRENFGPVLLDYPTCVKLDPRKTKCHCGGDIAVDGGFNKLICTRCGYEFLISELAKDIENEIIIVERGSSKMSPKFITSRDPEWAARNDSGMANPYIDPNKVEIPKAVSSIPTLGSKFMASSGKVKHNTNPKVKMPSSNPPVKKDNNQNKNMNRGYVKDKNNGKSNKYDIKMKKYNDQAVISMEKHNEVIKELDLAKTELFAAEENNAKLTAKIAECDKLAQEKDNTINDLLEQISELNSSQTVDTDKKDLEDKISSLESKLTVAEEVTKTVKANLATRDEEYAKLLKENEELKTQTQKITENEVVVDRSEYNDLLTSIDDMSNTIESMTLESSSLKGELNDSKHLTDRLNEKISILEKELSGTDDKGQKIATLSSEKEELENEIHNLKENLEKIKFEKDDQIQKLRDELSDMSLEYDKMHEENMKLKHQQPLGDSKSNSEVEDISYDSSLSEEDYSYMTKFDDAYALSVKLTQIKDVIEDSDDETEVLVLHIPSDENEILYNPDGHPYVIDTIGGIPVEDLTIIRTDALEKLKIKAEHAEQELAELKKKENNDSISE